MQNILLLTGFNQKLLLFFWKNHVFRILLNFFTTFNVPILLLYNFSDTIQILTIKKVYISETPDRSQSIGFVFLFVRLNFSQKIPAYQNSKPLNNISFRSVNYSCIIQPGTTRLVAPKSPRFFVIKKFNQILLFFIHKKIQASSGKIKRNLQSFDKNRKRVLSWSDPAPERTTENI